MSAGALHGGAGAGALLDNDNDMNHIRHSSDRPGVLSSQRYQQRGSRHSRHSQLAGDTGTWVASGSTESHGVEEVNG